MRFTILGSENHVVHRGFNQFKTLKSVFLPLHNMISMTTTQVYTDTATTRMIKKINHSTMLSSHMGKYRIIILQYWPLYIVTEQV